MNKASLSLPLGCVNTVLAMALLLSACTYGGIGMPTSPAWNMTASPEDKAKYYKDNEPAHSVGANAPSTQLESSVTAYNAAIQKCYKDWEDSDGTITFIQASECENEAVDTYVPTQQRDADIMDTYKRKHLQIARAFDKQQISMDVVKARVMKAWDQANSAIAARDKKEAAIAEKAERKAQVAQQQWQEEHDPINVKCKSYGFKKGTDSFANCAMKLEQAQTQQEQQQAALQTKLLAQQAEAEEERARRVAAFFVENARQERERAAAQRPIETNCRQVGYGFNCTTNNR